MPYLSASLALAAQFAVASAQPLALPDPPLGAVNSSGLQEDSGGTVHRQAYVTFDQHVIANTGGTLLRASDGLFYLTAQVNGVPVRFLVDTGATTIVLTPEDAERAGISALPGAAPHSAETAGGTVAMARVRIGMFRAGPALARDVDAAISPRGLGVSLLGQCWLAQFKRITILGDTMIIQ